ncbi:hypothetical protein [Bacillus swezeyi]|uniref:hypothetical protein n=1 Tax=Bacillus swezeyi TaxID=1925020 RepID=UPI00123B71A0|nr:hypothetical protein [Bacillus swezeyi]KAA6482207.1 hypothetical protein DX928_03640 [Bacillus swezeyi]
MNDNLTEILILISQAKKAKNTENKRILIFGSLTHILLSKSIINRNDEIPNFIKKIFRTDFKDYVYKSRTLVVARVARIVEKMSLKDLDNVINQLIKLFESENNSINNVNNSVIKTIDNWVKVINNVQEND